MVAIAKKCGISINRDPPTKGVKTMKELCVEIQKKRNFKNMNHSPTIQKIDQFPTSSEDFTNVAKRLFTKYGYRSYFDGIWQFFEKGVVNTSVNPDASNQWKVFFNPKKLYFFSVLEIIIKTLKDQPGVLGKIIQNPFIVRKSDVPVIDDPHEPKMLLYFIDTTSKLAKERLRRNIELILEQIPPNQIDEISLPCSKKIREGVMVETCGQSFTKQLNRLIYYGQGGYSETSRKALFGQAQIKGQKVTDLLKTTYDGENYYKYISETDPFD